ncbi:SH3 domain-containing protein 19 isoform X3 [Sceloporus undulatus]|uniref:SH3 domain-containing protein 19 isoform X3 n=1 Tax=Sceloporus undulatus TaxID=8520 RepID=UPI001C4AFCDD|nr:SH3 domain-containing protein 19 isoform X3 [Sceloporus undulatus]
MQYITVFGFLKSKNSFSSKMTIQARKIVLREVNLIIVHQGLITVATLYYSRSIESTVESQGPLSSIKAAIKRTSRTSGHSEQQRDRRRPEITIVAAEPLGPSSWFPGGNHVPQQGLVFQSSHTQAIWRTSELVPAEPPSYEQVIKEINQVQVNTTSNNNAATAAYSRRTATSSTQTDFPEEIIKSLPSVNVKNNLHALSECKSTPGVQIPRMPPRPSSSLLNSNHSINAELLVVLEDQSCQEKPNAVIYPIPKPRSKGNLKPIVTDIQNNIQGNQVETRQSETEKDTPSIHFVSLLDDNFWDSHMVMENMDTDKSQSSIVSRIKAFEMQTNMEPSGLTKKPEVSPRSLGPKPVVSAKKPVVAPKPGANRTSGEWDSWTETKLKTISQERPLPLQGTGSNIITKPELPKKPKPVIVKSSSNGLLNSGTKPASENNEGQRKSPVPTPRPVVPRKSVSFENPVLPLLPLKPVSATPRLSVAAQTSAFRSLVETPTSGPSTTSVQSTSSAEGDLISFDDEVLPVNSAGMLQELTRSESDLLNLISKPEPAKEHVAQPAVVRKPTVIRIPSKPAKALNEVAESPPPLPTEKPIGNTSGISAGKPNNIITTKKVESEYSNSSQLYKNQPFMPPRPSEGKMVPARPPPPKGAPGRPPPPKSTKSSSQTGRFSRSASDMALHKKSSLFGLEVKQTKSDVIKNLDPALPPRPKPGHPLYNKYMLPVPHGIAKEDIPLQNTGHLSCKGDVLVLVDKVDNSCVECQKGKEKGKVQLSQMQIITPLDDSLKSKQKGSDNMWNVSDPSAPHAVVLHNFIAEQTGDLDLNSGEIVYLLEKIDDEWYRGKCMNRTGIFPASFVKVIVDISRENNRRKTPFSSPSIVGPRCIARFEYIGDQKDELSFSEGEIIILKEYVNEEWAEGELRGTSGIFPLNFVEIIEDLPEPGGGSPLKNKNSAPVKESDGHAGEWCDALHDFTAETQEDLSFKKGDHILILEHLDSEWYRGRLNGKEGIFPAVFVHVCSGNAQVSQPADGKKEKAKALYDFHAENIDELSFKVGDIITELESIDEEWLSGKLHGKSGIFPKNFVQIIQLS